MKIQVTYGAYEGRDRLESYTLALLDAGVIGRFIQRPSLIPPGTEVEIEKRKGDKGICTYYGVMSHAYQNIPEKCAFAGIGWIQDRRGNGIFMRSYGGSEEEVSEDLGRQLKVLVPQTSGPKIDMKVIGITCQSKPVSAVVCAIYAK